MQPEATVLRNAPASAPLHLHATPSEVLCEDER